MTRRNNATQTDPIHFDPVDWTNTLLQNVKDYTALQLTNIPMNYCQEPAHILISQNLYINSFLLCSVNHLKPKIHLYI